MKTINIETDTRTGFIKISFGDNVYRSIEEFTHPIKKQKLYCFISTKEILPDTYPLHSILEKKNRYANIFEEEIQQKIKEYINR